ncbi:MAG: thiamine-phosphate kinase [Acidibrevibacterium sp.]|jgi:thiamine-monophosphate kinase|uniref:thiamine-phosphate kinase n=1 Tax=Acidibrevibacterium fodinaquatile TaxID=1969806 RepID=UPI0023A7D9FC|nr:thiamine-phosphate kinase [Acidibrevibacterium fodinaquatile]MCA7117966.1 thiamine-phosphate kinase [Acidibrevibacterium fodinaquatile]
MTDLPREFALIETYFRPLAGPAGLALADDAAILPEIPGREWVVSVDAMVAGVHFLAEDPPDSVARKLLRVNLSDLAAMAAKPFGYLLTLAAPATTPDAWFKTFAAGLAEDQARFGLALLGGDTTRTPGPLTLSLTIFGEVAAGRALRRAGAQAGDEVWVSGTIGDAALGLLVRRGELADPSGSLLHRYLLPEPRLGLALAGIARAGADISDGLVQDLGHLCRAGGIGAVIEAQAVPLSPAARAAGAAYLARCLTGGDDYELVLAVPPERAAALRAAAAAAGVPLTRIGHFRAEPRGVVVVDGEGAEMALGAGGWSHF